jgi:hypothetical protein
MKGMATSRIVHHGLFRPEAAAYAEKGSGSDGSADQPKLTGLFNCGTSTRDA